MKPGMTFSGIKQLINKQAAIHKCAGEIYETEACEIIVYDAILDFCIINQFSIGPYKAGDLKNDQVGGTDEKWMIITELYADMLSEENKLSTDPAVIELLNYYHNKFWES